MITVNDILEFMESVAPSYMKMDWDNVGLLCGSRNKEVKTVLVALDPFAAVCQEAAEIGADLLITHHPLIFGSINAVTDETDTGRAIQTLIRNNICSINAHTNLDCAPGGVNDILAAKLGLNNIEVISPAGTDSQGRPWGLLRKGAVKEQSMEAFAKHVKEALDCQGVRYTGSGKVCKVAVGGGACGGELLEAYRAGCDTFVTADVKYNQFFDAQALGLNLIDAGHFHTENPVCRHLAQELRSRFPELEVKISQKHCDCTKFL